MAKQYMFDFSHFFCNHPVYPDHSDSCDLKNNSALQINYCWCPDVLLGAFSSVSSCSKTSYPAFRSYIYQDMLHVCCLGGGGEG
jgi:hypothetical protein